MNVTFDSNVWEKVIDEDDHHFVKIKNKIRTGEIRPYICQIALSLEAIEKKLRAEFFESYKPSIKFEELPTEDSSLHTGVCFKPNEELHPGFHPKLRCKLLKARDLGFRVLRMTNVGTVRPREIPDDMYVDFVSSDEFWKYADPLARCSEYIIALGCGQAAYNQFKEKFNLDGLDSLDSQAIPTECMKKFVEAIAEWVDGDSLSAHYASGNELFCTNDQAGNAGTGSIFNSQNRTRIEREFGIKIISSCEAAQL